VHGSDRDEALLSLAPCVFLELDPVGRVTWANDVAGDVFGASGASGLYAKSLHSFAMQEDREGLQAAILEAAAGKRVEVEFQIHGVRPPRAVRAVMRGFGGRDGGRMLVSAVDISGERDLVRVIELAPTPMLVSRAVDGRILMVNDAFCGVTGYARSEILGQPSSWMFRDPDVRARIVECLMAGGPVVGEQVRFTDSAGGARVVLLSGQACLVLGEETVVWQGLDITERRRHQERVQQLDRLESLGVLAGGIAHDYNNLLLAILGHVQMARAHSQDTDVTESLDRALEAASRAAQVTRELLNYAGGSKVETEAVDVDAIVDDSVGLSMSTMLAGHHVQRSYARDGRRVAANGTHLRQILTNLLANASDALGEQRGHVTLSVSTIEVEEGDEGWLPRLGPGEYRLLEVADDGPGFGLAAAVRAFEPFFSTRPQGRGLGLASVLGLARRHQGAVRIAPSSQGARVQVAIPFIEEGASTADDAAEREPERPRRLLVVDDDPSVLRAVRSMARAGGWQVVPCDGIDSAELALAREPPDVVLLDVRMPGVRGAEGLRRVRELVPDVPVVLMSGWVEEHVRDELDDVGHSGFFEKPFGAELLYEALEATWADRE